MLPPRNKSIILIPIFMGGIRLFVLIGSIWLLVLYVTYSEPYPNAYGPSPKYSAGPDKTDLIDDVLA